MGNSLARGEKAFKEIFTFILRRGTKVTGNVQCGGKGMKIRARER